MKIQQQSICTTSASRLRPAISASAAPAISSCVALPVAASTGANSGASLAGGTFAVLRLLPKERVIPAPCTFFELKHCLRQVNVMKHKSVRCMHASRQALRAAVAGEGASRALFKFKCTFCVVRATHHAEKVCNWRGETCTGPPASHL